LKSKEDNSVEQKFNRDARDGADVLKNTPGQRGSIVFCFFLKLVLK
jgi:hypothetical protein